ncbi:MAG: amidohydrolase family protein [Myxococcota bacterium]|nr:amidohydrolase family protein [Myxococcota bacterium]
MERVFRNGLWVGTGPDARSVQGDARVVDGVIVEIASEIDPGDAEVEELNGKWVFPGFSQSHVHLCQTLFRGLAEDLELLDWLGERIWPLEAAHDEDSTYWSARLGITELLLGGTTSILDMGSLRHTDATLTACEESGIRAACGRALMDRENSSGLSESMDANLLGACDEADRWHGRGRLRYAFAPRFVPSCSEELLRAVVQEARDRGCVIHTHASENEAEVELVRSLTGMDNVEYLHEIGMTGGDVCLAHCIHLTDAEERILAETGTHLLHCPSSNLKLGSGVARIPELLARGVRVSLGADGAPCNNGLDIFREMRLAGLIQKPRLGTSVLGPGAILEMATTGGAAATGLGSVSGSLEVGKAADFVVVDPNHPTICPQVDPVVAAVYSLSPAAIVSVWIEGGPVVRDGRVLAWDAEETARAARDAALRVRRTAGL